ncbi:MAG: class I SAM-dependent methyltransferase [Coriobacteriia bacterium]|nr:class I SAM-dependent methyltransferase [Coriobacteriia bacterium]
MDSRFAAALAPNLMGACPEDDSPFGVSHDALGCDIVEYWDNRSGSYSSGVMDEVDTDQWNAWGLLLHEQLSDVIRLEREESDAVDFGRPRVLDLGCGPGFFEMLLSQMGCAVVGIDSSPEMLKQAMANVEALGQGRAVSFLEGDVSQLPFEAGSFDLVVSRNVTWLMRNPQACYQEWLRVLKPGGKLLVFDANWYRYLVDEPTNEDRLRQQVDIDSLGYREESRATDDEESRCEIIARQLPLTYELRPAWDVTALESLGARGVMANDEIWKRVWTEGEQSFYGSSPLFMVEASK